MRSLFHLAFNVTDLDAARRLYGGVLVYALGCSTETCVDFDFSDPFGRPLAIKGFRSLGSL